MWAVSNASEPGRKSELAAFWAWWLHNPAVKGIPKTLKEGTKSELPHKSASWLHTPCRMQGPQCFELGDEIRSGPNVGLEATYPLRG